jgi:hypothetical protein
MKNSRIIMMKSWLRLVALEEGVLIKRGREEVRSLQRGTLEGKKKRNGL